ncbi:HGxxPAAW family protein [Brachybacterium sp. AOP29-B2-41]|uniref:HGxxPAAW family protein n=1 Tax=Brachybacterium sp. AOP29-B2-41 TaxID=3457704 RepID=UPI004033DC3B
MPKTYAVPPPPHHNEGKTVAGWTMNLGIVLGSIPIAAGMILSDMTMLIWIGAGIIVLAIVVGVVLSLAGLGQPRGYSQLSAEVTADGGANARGHVPADGGTNARGNVPAEADAR